MVSRIADFNYKVALASGLKSLQGGRLRQAEEQFRYLIGHFPSAEGGYRGLAKVLLEQGDRAGALRMLLEGGAALAKADQRTGAIALYREAIGLVPSDLGAHRRLVAALINAGETDAAVTEFVRFIRGALGARDNDLATREAEYALERLPGNPQIEAVARNAGALAPLPRFDAPIPSEPLSVEDRDALVRSALGTPAPPTTTATWAAAEPPATEPRGTPPKRVADPWATPEEVSQQEADEQPIAADTDAHTVEAIAARFLAKGDPRGGAHALEAARRYIADGHMDAASDLLLDLVASGIATHDAQRLLLDVARGLGKNDVARAKLALLVEMLKLDGRTDLAAEVEQLAQGS